MKINLPFKLQFAVIRRASEVLPEEILDDLPATLPIRENIFMTPEELFLQHLETIPDDSESVALQEQPLPDEPAEALLQEDEDDFTLEANIG